MAFVGLVSGVSGDLNVAAFDFGYFDDIVLAVEDTGYDIKTYEGNDIIDYSRLASSNFLWTAWCGSGDGTALAVEERSPFMTAPGTTSFRSVRERISSMLGPAMTFLMVAMATTM